jgi:hypothetical protein
MGATGKPSPAKLARSKLRLREFRRQRPRLGKSLLLAFRFVSLEQGFGQPLTARIGLPLSRFTGPELSKFVFDDVTSLDLLDEKPASARGRGSPAGEFECRHGMGLVGGTKMMPCRSTHQFSGDARQVHSLVTTGDHSSISSLQMMPCQSTHQFSGDAWQVRSLQFTLAGTCQSAVSQAAVETPVPDIDFDIDLYPDALTCELDPLHFHAICASQYQYGRVFLLAVGMALKLSHINVLGHEFVPPELHHVEDLQDFVAKNLLQAMLDRATLFLDVAGFTL